MGLGSLETPVGSDFIKNFPSQNEVNCNLIDAYAGPCLPSHAIQTYTPGLTATTTNPTLGTGTLLGYYYRIFDQIWTWGQFTFGAGFNRGVGTYEIALPFRARSSITPGGVFLTSPPIAGVAQVYDQSSGADRQPALSVLNDATKLRFRVRLGTAGASRFVSDVIPFTFVQDDGVMWSARYQRE
jgi:hypothetical protein